MNKHVPTLKRKLIVSSFASILIPVIIICLICYWLLSYNAHRSQVSADADLIRQIGKNTYYSVRSIESQVRNICYSDDLQDYLWQYNSSLPPQEPGAHTSSPDLLLTRLSVNRALQNQAHVGQDFENLVVFSMIGEVLGSTERFDADAVAGDYDWLEQARESYGRSIWLPERSDSNNLVNSSGRLLPVAKKIRSLKGRGTDFASDIGYALVYINLDSFLSSVGLKSYYTDRVLMLVDSGNRIIGGEGYAQFDRGFPFPLNPDGGNGKVVRTADGQRYLLSVQAVNCNGWYVACLSDYAATFREANVALAICVLVSIFLMAVFFVASSRNADSVVAPVKALHNAFKVVETGNFSLEKQPESNILELQDLSDRFGVMVNRLDRLVNEVYESELKEQQLIAEVRQTQIEALQMQINPHFLYNTLDSINWMALMAGNENISTMVQALGDIFRFNVSIEQIYCTVAAEVENTGRFMYIQHVRLQPRLTYSIEVDGGVRQYKVLKLLLQPLAENAIKHGMEPRNMECAVIIRIEELDKKLWITVSDNGVGMEAELQDELNRCWENIVSGAATEDKVGLINVMKRLYLCYGKEASFRVESGRGRGTTIRISIPCQMFDLKQQKE